jgi:hypothetical protein
MSRRNFGTPQRMVEADQLGRYSVLRNVRGHLNYANVVATVAVFIALGGTSYAVVSLPRNSVGQRQLKSSSVGSAELRAGAIRSKNIHNGSVATRDLSKGAKRDLRGQQGPPGSQGPPGAAAVTLSVAVATSGATVSGNGTSEHSATAAGVYEVSFPRVSGPGNQDLRGCRAVATLSRADDGSTPTIAPNGEIVTEPTQDGVTVHTYNSAGSPTDLPFHLIVVC